MEDCVISNLIDPWRHYQGVVGFFSSKLEPHADYIRWTMNPKSPNSPLYCQSFGCTHTKEAILEYLTLDGVPKPWKGCSKWPQLGNVTVTMLQPHPLHGRNHKGCILALHHGTSVNMGFHVTKYTRCRKAWLCARSQHAWRATVWLWRLQGSFMV